jgi:2-succinyl-6-hydroxy-2,4-cyclohexadiene-1-carboxylate synthase
MNPSRIRIDNVTIAYEVLGSGPVLLLIHGFTGDRTTMAGLADALAGHRTVVSVDLLGHGDSSSPPEIVHYSMAAASRHLTAVLIDVGATRADVVGYSLGGRVALSFACARPDLVGSLALIGASPGLIPPADHERRLADDQLADSIATNGLEAFVDRWMALPMWDSLRGRLGERDWEAARQQRLENSPTGLANSLRGMGSGAMPALHDQLHSLEPPTLLVTGREDTKFTRIATEMASALPNASTVVIDQAGHATHLEQPRATSNAIIEHLQCG